MARLSTLLALALALLSFSALASATLYWDEEGGGTEPRRTVVLPSFGDASVTISVYNPFGELSVDVDEAFVSVSEPIVAGLNYTLEFSFSGDVGVSPFTISAGEAKLEGEFVIAGFVILEDGKIVSGEARDGVTVGQKGEFEYEVKAVGTDGNKIDLKDVAIDPRPQSGVYMEEIDRKNTGFDDGVFTLAINKYRVGSGNLIVSFEATSIEYKGETFETVLHVKQDTEPVPPCVVVGNTLTNTDGVVDASMFNILSPPRASPVDQIVLNVAGQSVVFSSDKSQLDLPTSTVVFEGVTGIGAAEITCDGEPAVVLGEDGQETDDLSVVAGSGTASEPLAKDELVDGYPSSDSESLVTSTIRVVNSSPETLTVAQARVIANQFCEVIKCKEFGIKSITKGSAKIDIGGLVEDPESANDDLERSFAECEFQKETEYECEDLELLGTRVNAVAASVASAGIATWTIVLIAVVGAIALIAVLSLTAWAVHRRNSVRESESSYSSSGPLGVPDPSDLLYEQSIVRDVYGRGEDGGPSEQAAVLSERAAAMREEMPRPPSSSGLSRGNRSSDASSTYSV